MTADRTTNAEAAECVRQAYESVRNDPKIRARWIERYISANGPLISEADSRWRNHLRHAEEALSELEAAGDALSRLRNGVAAEREASYWADVVEALHFSGALAFNERHAARLMHITGTIRTRRIKRSRRMVLLDSKYAFSTREAVATEAAQLAYDVVMTSEEEFVPSAVVEILYQLSKVEGQGRMSLATALGSALFKRENRAQEIRS